MFPNKDILRPRSSQTRKKPSQSVRGKPSASSKPAEPPSVGKHLFKPLYAVGKGGFGRVWRVRSVRTKEQFAMKEMLKLRVVSKRSVHSVMNERKLLEHLHHPFIVNMHYAFQDRDNLYLVLDYLSGGDLRYHIGRQRRFSEAETQFFIACIITGLEYLHVNRTIHRDIKPENLVLDDKGYVYITDFGIARPLTKDNAKDTSGTPGYMAPEVMIRQNHGIEADYFAVGVIAYEFMLGRRPYLGRNRKEIRDHMLSKQVYIKKEEIPESWSLEAVDFINQLLQRKNTKRLGRNGPHELKAHPWLNDFPWMDLLYKSLKAPFVPKKGDNFDERVNGDWVDEIDTAVTQNSMKDMFSGYSFESKRKFEPFIHDTIRLNHD